MTDYGYITFKSVSYAMKFETTVKKYSINFRLIPVPRSISSSCGLSVRFNLDDIEEFRSIIEKEKLEYENIYTDL